MGKSRIVLMAILGALLLVIVYGMGVEPYQVEVRHILIRNVGLNEVLAGKTAVHLSDLHIAKIGRREERVFRILEELRPDLIFLTGDYVPWNGDYEPALTFLSRLSAPLGVWAVIGDADYSNSRKSCLFCHEPGTGKPTKRHAVRFLRNTAERVELPEGHMWIGGTDVAPEHRLISINTILPRREDAPVIFLSHSPLAFDHVDEDRELFVLAGDTHGGQIYLPTRLWRLLGSEKCARYNQGLFRKGSKRMYVSRGIGTSHLPLRILRRPEVVVLHF